MIHSLLFFCKQLTVFFFLIYSHDESIFLNSNTLMAETTVKSWPLWRTPRPILFSQSRWSMKPSTTWRKALQSTVLSHYTPLSSLRLCHSYGGLGEGGLCCSHKPVITWGLKWHRAISCHRQFPQLQNLQTPLWTVDGFSNWVICNLLHSNTLPHVLHSRS